LIFAFPFNEMDENRFGRVAMVSAARLVTDEAGNIAGGATEIIEPLGPGWGALLLAAAFRQRSFSPVFVSRQRLG
jgi:hypothetical protein